MIYVGSSVSALFLKKILLPEAVHKKATINIQGWIHAFLLLLFSIQPQLRQRGRNTTPMVSTTHCWNSMRFLPHFKIIRRVIEFRWETLRPISFMINSAARVCTSVKVNVNWWGPDQFFVSSPPLLLSPSHPISSLCMCSPSSVCLSRCSGFPVCFCLWSLSSVQPCHWGGGAGKFSSFSCFSLCKCVRASCLGQRRTE